MTTDFQRIAKGVDLLTSLYLAPKRRVATYGRRRAVDHRQSRSWGWRSNIVGVGVAHKVVSGSTSSDLALTLFVRRKLAKSRLSSRQLIPPMVHLRTAGAPVPTDIVELRGTMIGHAAPAVMGVSTTDRVRPLQPRLQVTHQLGFFGALCAVVRWDQRPGKVFGLGCSHTLARCGIGVEPDEDAIEQPHLLTFDIERNFAGILSPAFTKITFDRNRCNKDDFALFEIDRAAGGPTNEIFGCGRTITSFDTRTAEQLSSGELETELFRVASPIAQGRIRAYKSSWPVDIRLPNNELQCATFEGVVAYETSCSEGDSGAPVLEKGTGKLLGMHFAGTQSDNVGLFIPAASLFTANGLSLI